MHCSFRFLFLQEFILLICYCFDSIPLSFNIKASEEDWLICINDDSVILKKKSCLVFGKEENLSCWKNSIFLQSQEFLMSWEALEEKEDHIPCLVKTGD